MTDNCCDLGDLLTDGLDVETGLLVVRAFTALWHGTAPNPEDVAHDVDPTEASEVFRRLATVGRCELGSDGRIIGVHGITQRPTRHQITHLAGGTTPGVPSTPSASPPPSASTPQPKPPARTATRRSPSEPSAGTRPTTQRPCSGSRPTLAST